MNTLICEKIEIVIFDNIKRYYGEKVVQSFTVAIGVYCCPGRRGLAQQYPLSIPKTSKKEEVVRYRRAAAGKLFYDTGIEKTVYRTQKCIDRNDDYADK